MCIAAGLTGNMRKEVSEKQFILFAASFRDFAVRSVRLSIFLVPEVLPLGGTSYILSEKHETGCFLMDFRSLRYSCFYSAVLVVWLKSPSHLHVCQI